MADLSMATWTAGDQMRQNQQAQNQDAMANLQKLQGLVSLQDLVRQSNTQNQLRGILQNMPEGGGIDALNSVMPQLMRLGPEGVQAGTQMAQSMTTMDQLQRMANIRKGAAALASGGQPSMSNNGAVPSAQPFGNSNVTKQQIAQLYLDNGDVDSYTKIMPKVKDWKEFNVNGQIQYAPLFEDGSSGNPVPLAVAQKMHFVDNGQRAGIGMNEYTGQVMTPGVQKQMTPGEIASNSIARQGLNIRKVEADPMGVLGLNKNGLMSAAGAPVANGAIQSGGTRGADFLNTIPKPIADQVKALAEGRMSFPAGFALKSPYWQNMISMVSQYDPNFDAVNYNARAKTRGDFTSGPSANNITALNTAIAHLGALSDSYSKLGNSDYPTYNAVSNYLGNQLGNKNIQGNTATVGAESEAVAHELAKVFRQTGMSEGEINAWKQKINQNLTPSQMQATIGAAVDLMNGRLQALGARYDQGMGTTSDPMQLLTPQAQATLAKLKGAAPIQPQANAQPSAGKVVDFGSLR